MEACLRGFSFIPDINVDVMDLQFVEGGELERTWKSTRRQRIKEQESKIWTEFIQEQDSVDTILKDDPYQFIEELPVSIADNDEMANEISKYKILVDEDNARKSKLKESCQDGDHAKEATSKEVIELNADDKHPNQNNVTFADQEKSTFDMFHIFDDDGSGPEDEVCEDSPPCTVREKEVSEDEKEVSPPRPPTPPAPVENAKQTVTVSNIMENSIYCAKVKDLRLKIKDELSTAILTLENKFLFNIDPEEAVKMRKRSNEFCARFTRIHLYQLKRQINDIERNNVLSLPFAKHTQFQAQMVRIISLHQNVYHSLQVLYKSLEQSALLPDGVAVLRTLCQLLRTMTEVCKTVNCPQDFIAIKDLYNDELTTQSEKLDDTANEYEQRIGDLFSNSDTSASPSMKWNPKTKGKKRCNQKSNVSARNKADTRLSMYSLETRGLSKIFSKSSSVYSTGSRPHQNVNGQKDDKANEQEKKSPKIRRPLMRDPNEGNKRTHKRVQKEHEIQTMVESVEPCLSSHNSREGSAKNQHEISKTPRTFRSVNTPGRHASRDRTPRSFRSVVTPAATKTVSPRTKTVGYNNSTVVPVRSPRNVSKLEHVPKPILSPRQMTSVAMEEYCLQTKESSILDVKPMTKFQVKCMPKKVVKKEEDEWDRQENGSRDAEVMDGELAADFRLEEQSNGEVGQLLKRLCGDGSGSRYERVTTKNVQLIHMTSTSPRQPSTTELLRILEETIQKKTPRQPVKPKPKDKEKLCLTFNIPETTAQNLMQYRTSFIQHMLSSPMYANSVIGKPWEMIDRVSEQIIEELLLKCAKEMEIEEKVNEIYKSETS